MSLTEKLYFKLYSFLQHIFNPHMYFDLSTIRVLGIFILLQLSIGCLTPGYPKKFNRTNYAMKLEQLLLRDRNNSNIKQKFSSIDIEVGPNVLLSIRKSRDLYTQEWKGWGGYGLFCFGINETGKGIPEIEELIRSEEIEFGKIHEGGLYTEFNPDEIKVNISEIYIGKSIEQVLVFLEELIIEIDPTLEKISIIFMKKY